MKSYVCKEDIHLECVIVPSDDFLLVINVSECQIIWTQIKPDIVVAPGLGSNCSYI